MTTAAEYAKRLEAIRLDVASIEVSTIGEANAALTRIRLAQKEVRQIKTAINLDMKTIRAKYEEKIQTAGMGGSAFFTLMGKWKVAGQHRAGAKRNLAAERDRELKPYESLRLAADNLLLQMDKAKILVQNCIDEAKAEQ